MARIHELDFDPRTTALLGSALNCRGAGSAPVGQASEVEITRYEGNRIEARVQGGGGLLIFSEVDYPGWRATVDGVIAPILLADGIFRALALGPGEHEIRFVYKPSFALYFERG